MANRLDLLIFGATGFTGIHCIPYCAKLSKAHGRNLTWGVAGRSEDKLRKALGQMGNKHGINLDSIPVVIADINSHESLVNMAKQARVVINCVGPYRVLGEAVVTACIEAGTHHVDISGEPEYMEKIQLEYFDAALAKGVYVISACGFDSIPADMGTIFVQQSFEGTLHSVNTYLKVWIDGDIKGSAGNYGTWETAVESFAKRGELRDIRRQLNEKFQRLPRFSPKQKTKILPHRPGVVPGWAVPFLGADKAVALRSQGFLYQNGNVRPLQVEAYFVLPSFFYLLIFLFYGTIFGLFSFFNCGRQLLLKNPERFSNGYFSKEQPSEEIIEKTCFTVDFYGEGWKEELPNKEAQCSVPVDRFIKARVTGSNPAYGSTCVSLILSGIMILTETEKLINKGRGGVYSPGAAFANTSIIKELHENGLTFEVLTQEDVQRRKCLGC